MLIISQCKLHWSQKNVLSSTNFEWDFDFKMSHFLILLFKSALMHPLMPFKLAITLYVHMRSLLTAQYCTALHRVSLWTGLLVECTQVSLLPFSR